MGKFQIIDKDKLYILTEVNTIKIHVRILLFEGQKGEFRYGFWINMHKILGYRDFLMFALG